MLKDRPIFRFVLLFATCCTLFLLSGLEKVYNRAFPRISEAIVINPRADVLVYFRDSPKPHSFRTVLINRELATFVKGPRNSEKINGPNISTDSRGGFFNFLGLALLLSLVIATPMPIKRKLWSLGLGFGLFHVWVYLKMVIYLAYLPIQHTASLQLEATGSFGISVWNTLYQAFVQQLPPSLMIAVVIWFAVSFRWSDVKQLFPKPKLATD